MGKGEGDRRRAASAVEGSFRQCMERREVRGVRALGRHLRHPGFVQRQGRCRGLRRHALWRHPRGEGQGLRSSLGEVLPEPETGAPWNHEAADSDARIYWYLDSVHSVSQKQVFFLPAVLSALGICRERCAEVPLQRRGVSYIRYLAYDDRAAYQLVQL